MNINFSDKTILVTGATRGIGAKIAEDLSNLGANLLLTGTDEYQIEKLNKKMISSKKKIRYFVLNPIKKNTVEPFFKEINKYERIDCIVNNAGINRLNYINKTLTASGFVPTIEKSIVPRTDGEDDIIGKLYLCRKQ